MARELRALEVKCRSVREIGGGGGAGETREMLGPKDDDLQTAEKRDLVASRCSTLMTEADFWIRTANGDEALEGTLLTKLRASVKILCERIGVCCSIQAKVSTISCV